MEQRIFSLGRKKDPKDNRDYLFSTIKKDISNETTIAKIVDYTSQMSPVKNQGKAGTCVGMAVTAVKEWQEQQEQLAEIQEGKKYKRKQKYYDLSEQWAYYKAKEIDPWPNEEGTSIRFALKQICNLGIPPEKAWPYNDAMKGNPKPWATLIARWGKGKSYYRIKDLSELTIAIHDHGPVVIGITCFAGIFNAPNGIVPLPSQYDQPQGGHALAAVGYNTNSQYVKIKNSWSTAWGDNGYGYLPFEYINKYMDDAWVLIDQHVSKEELRNK